jgi:hypothetical protein
MPQYLPIVLKCFRFQVHGKTVEKDRHVTFSLERLDTDNKGPVFLRNIGNYSIIEVLLHSRRISSSKRSCIVKTKE